MRYLFGLFGLLLVTVAQAELLKVESYLYYPKPNLPASNEPLKLPYLTSTNAKVAKKINDSIFMDVFKSPAPAKLINKLNLPKIDDTEFDEASGIASMDYKVSLNNGKVLALATEGEYCGAYCEESEHYYNFDAKNGNQLKIEDFFRKNNLKTLQNKVF